MIDPFAAASLTNGLLGITDPVRWSEAFNAIPTLYKGTVLGLAALFIAFRWWPWRRKNGD